MCASTYPPHLLSLLLVFILTQSVSSTNLASDERDNNDLASAEVTLTSGTEVADDLQFTTAKIIWQNYKAAKVGVELGTYASPVILVIGVIGNILSIAVMMEKANRNNAFAIYLSALAVADTGSLLTWAYRWYMMMLVGRGMGDLECKLDVGCKYAFRMAGYLLILSLTADRFIVVRFPLRAPDWSTSGRASVVSATIMVTSFLYAAPYFIWGRQNKGYACVFISSGNVYATYYMWSVVLFGLVLPFSLVTYMNSVIIVTIRHRLQYRGKCSAHSKMATAGTSTSTSGTEVTATSGYEEGEEGAEAVDESQIKVSVANESMKSSATVSTSTSGCKDCAVAKKPLSRKDRNLINILLLVTAFFLIFNSPQLIRVARSYVWDTKATLRMRANEYLAFQVTNNLSNVNYAINFFLYCLSGTKFRSDLAKLFGC